MLEQRRAQQKGYITLKEAATLAGYTPDYVGQLIRAGKIHGEQVYSGTAWMTTREEVEAYLKDKGKSSPGAKGTRTKERLYNPILSWKGQHLLLGFVVLFGTAILIMQYAIYLALTGQSLFGNEAPPQSEMALYEHS